MNPSGGNCPLSSQPAACFSKVQASYLQHNNRHSWESIGICDGCKFSRINAEICHVPEPDEAREAAHFFAKPDPKDFLDKCESTKPKKNGPPRATHCPKGHDKMGKSRCRVCQRDWHREKVVKELRKQMRMGA